MAPILTRPDAEPTHGREVVVNQTGLPSNPSGVCPTQKLLILVPTLNEQTNVVRALREILAHLPNSDILVIDDDSNDGTWQTVERLQADLRQIYLLQRRGRTPGLAPSICDGYRYALDHGYEAVCILDCDLQQDPADILRMCMVRPPASVVIGSRYVHRRSFRGAYPNLSKWTSLLANLATRVLFQFPYKDATTDFCLVDIRVLRQIPPESLVSLGYAVFFELKLRAWKAGFPIQELAVQTYGRQNDSSHRTCQQIFRFIKDVMAIWVKQLLS